jgi:hypothetical protein
LKSRSSKRVGGSHPEEHYSLATRKNLHLDKPTSHGGWPEGEYDPPVNDRIYGYLKSMGLIREFVEAVIEAAPAGASGQTKKPISKVFSPVPEGKDWICWTRKETDDRAQAGTLAWSEDFLNSILQGFGLTGKAYESVRQKAENFLANTRFDAIFNAAGDQQIKGEMPLNKLLKAIAISESQMLPTAGDGGGAGLMQLTPPALEQIKQLTGREIDPRDPKQSIEGAATYIKWLDKRPSLSNLVDLMNAYNTGLGIVGKIKAGVTKKDGQPYRLNDPDYTKKIGALYQLMRAFEIEQSDAEPDQFAGLKTDLDSSKVSK